MCAILFFSGASCLEDTYGLVEWNLREPVDWTRLVVRTGTKSWHAMARFHSQARGPGSCTTQHISEPIPGDEGTFYTICDNCSKWFLYDTLHYCKTFHEK